jgi:hypothetical protein
LEQTGLAELVETRGLTGTGLGLARQESAGGVFGRVWNRTDTFLRSKPGPLAGYPDPMLTLGGLAMVLTFVIADSLIGIVIMLVHQNHSPDIGYIQHHTQTADWKFKHLIGNEDWLSSAMQVQVLSQCVLLDSSGNSDSSPG